MNIRLLEPSDAATYRAVRLRGLEEFPTAFTSSHEEEAARPIEWYAERLAGANTRFWGAFEDGELCGLVGIEREQKPKNRHKALVIGMYVASERTGRGIGRALVDALVAHARQDGVELLVLTVTEGNRSAEALYERSGFRLFGVEPKAVKVGGRAYDKKHMYLELAPS